ncbi:sigma-54 interaction domain-containing protein [Clostridium sp. DL1XJH146]
MKKKLILITLEKKPREKYTGDLKEFFGNCIDIEGYSIREGISKKIYGDVALISQSVLPNIAQKYLDKSVEIVYLSKTFKKGSLDPLYKIPKNTEVLLVNNSSLGTIQTISLLYELGIKHIDFKPVYPGVSDIPNVKYTVTPGQISYIPENAGEIIDIGWRVINVSTLINLVTKLDLLNYEFHNKLEEYAEKTISANSGFDFVFENTNKIRNELNIVLDTIDDGVIVIDNNYKILHLNKSAEKILGVDDKELLGEKITNGLPVSLETFHREAIENLLVKYNPTNKSILITKRTIKNEDKIFGYVIILKDKTEIENLENQLRKQLVQKGHIAKYSFKDIKGVGNTLISCKEKAIKISKIDNPVLIIGESGTGKELFSQSIHNSSKRNKNPFLAINCATLSLDLLESELFGYEEGAFTGAKKGGKKGLFELSHKGSLFLDEIGELPINIQAKLLRVLQEKEVMRLGGASIIPVDVRIIAATNRDLNKLVKDGKFRKDLYYRLNVFPLNLPPLRERKEDIPYLIEDIFKEINIKKKKIDKGLMEILYNNYWDGNIRELRNCIEYMAYMGGSLLTTRDLPPGFTKTEYDKGNLIKESLFLGLTIDDSIIAEQIMMILKYRSAGRRFIYNELIKNSVNVSEYKIRNIMDFLYANGFILRDKGRKGSVLTDKGINIIAKINMRDENGMV